MRRAEARPADCLFYERPRGTGVMASGGGTGCYCAVPNSCSRLLSADRSWPQALGYVQGMDKHPNHHLTLGRRTMGTPTWWGSFPGSNCGCEGSVPSSADRCAQRQSQQRCPCSSHRCLPGTDLLGQKVRTLCLHEGNIAQQSIHLFLSFLSLYISLSFLFSLSLFPI